mmetsp:Transcript_55288/g.131326  ORF Transcript_55288/g.131326 Transcript_55288/m.131326 type:complete len:200 (-) Transcript_55288:44-643(-)
MHLCHPVTIHRRFHRTQTRGFCLSTTNASTLPMHPRFPLLIPLLFLRCLFRLIHLFRLIRLFHLFRLLSLFRLGSLRSHRSVLGVPHGARGGLFLDHVEKRVVAQLHVLEFPFQPPRKRLGERVVPTRQRREPCFRRVFLHVMARFPLQLPHLLGFPFEFHAAPSLTPCTQRSAHAHNCRHHQPHGRRPLDRSWSSAAH